MRTAQQKAKRNAYMREWQKRPENIEKVRRWHANWRKLHGRASDQRRWRLANPKKSLFYSAKYRAKVKQLEFTISLDDFELVNVCPVLGIPIIYGLARQSHNSPTIDRIDSSKGYIKGNVMVISWRANDLKRDASIGELRALSGFYGKLLRPRLKGGKV